MDNSFSSQDRYDRFDTAPCRFDIIQQRRNKCNLWGRYICGYRKSPNKTVQLTMTRQASVSISRLHEALAGLVEGRSAAGRPVVGNTYFW